jgi:hypothetical protein
MDRREFSQSIAALDAAIAVSMVLVTANGNAEAKDIPVRFVAAAWGELHD